MKIGDLVRMKTYPEALGVYIGEVTYTNRTEGEDYTCSKVFWNDVQKIQPVQTDLLEVVKI